MCVHTSTTVAHACTARAGEGSPTEQIILSIGDKGRSQLTRAEPEKFKYCFNETFKVKVTFAQVSERECMGAWMHGIDVPCAVCLGQHGVAFQGWPELPRGMTRTCTARRTCGDAQRSEGSR